MNRPKGLCWLVLLAMLAQPVTAEQLLIPVNAMAVPDFHLAATDGAEKSLADFAGTTLVINFWGSWCPPCRAEMPALQRLWQQTRSADVEVIGIAVADDPTAVVDFAQSHGIEFPLLLDRDGSLAQQWRARTLPTTYVLDAEHQIRYRATGERVWDAPDVVERILAIAGE